MKDFLLSQLAPYLATGVAAGLVFIIKGVGKEVRAYMISKRELADAALKASNHDAEVKAGWETWREIDEKFRITDKVEEFLGSKADAFDDLMIKKIPGITKENLISIRQAIAGEVNADREAVIDKSEVLGQLQATNATLISEKEQLTARVAELEKQLQAKDAELANKISAVQSAVLNTLSPDTTTAGTQA